MLESIFEHLDRLYQLDLEIDIQDFIVSRETCQRLGADPGRGAVLVKQDGDEELEMGLYLGEENLERLMNVDLSLSMSPSALEVLLLAIEEVSHFAYILFRASRRRPVTGLELELQAEVDKFVTSTMLLSRHHDGRVAENLLDRLFSDFVPRPGLAAEERERYLEASSLASRYCSYFVQKTLAKDGGFASLLPELRSFYRLGQRGKIGRIHNIVYSA